MDAATSQAILREHLEAISPLTVAEFRALFQEIKLAHYPPGSHFTRIGAATSTLGVVLHGLFRVYYLTPEGTALTRRFVPEGRIVGDLAALLAGDPTAVASEALEDSVLAVVPYAVMERLYDRYPGWQRFGRKLIERYYLIVERREYQFLAFPALTRYQLFLQEYPGLEHRVSQALIASYLGISPVSLSRIRSGQGKK